MINVADTCCEDVKQTELAHTQTHGGRVSQ
jgi:hypothetical protein